MPALTQQEWFDKISAWVPKWFFESEHYQAAVFQAIAKVLASADTEMRAQFAETFITEAADDMLDQHGYERSILRNTGETDENYALRIQGFAINLDPISIEALATTFLLTGEAKLWEHDIEGMFCDRDAMLNRRHVFSDIYYCAFSIVVPYQGGTAEATEALEALASAVNASKALGTLYQLVELSS